MAFALQARQTVHLNYGSPGLKITRVIKNSKRCPAETEQKMMKDIERDSQTVTRRSALGI